MRTTSALTAVAATTGVLLLAAVAAVDAQNTTVACLECTSFNKQQCEANNGDGECVWGGARSENDKSCITDSGEGCIGCGCDSDGGSGAFLVVLLLIIIVVTWCMPMCSGVLSQRLEWQCDRPPACEQFRR